MAADAAVDRRFHLGELDIEIRALQCAFGLQHGSLRRLKLLTPLINDSFGDSLGLDQLLRAFEFALRQIDPCLGIDKLSARLLGDAPRGRGDGRSPFEVWGPRILAVILVVLLLVALALIVRGVL